MRHGRLGFRSAATWTPLALGAALKGWYTADFGVYSDAGTTPAVDLATVQQWNDQSGNANHLSQATAGSRPQYLATGFNSIQGIRFVSDWLSTAFTLGGTTFSAFLAIYQGTVQDSGRIVTFYNTGDASDFNVITSGIAVMGKTGSLLQGYRTGAKSATVVSTLGTPIRLGAVFNGTNHTLYVDNVARPSVASSGTFGTTGTLYIGAGQGGGSPVADVTIAAALIVTGAISAGDLANIDAYLRSIIETPATITTIATQHNNEGTTLAIPLTALAMAETITWSIVGGADQAEFEISGTLLRWASNGVKDFESPDDSDANNIYSVTVRATGDSTGLTSDLPMTIVVADLNESAPLDIILDTDFGCDQDDAAALGVAIKRHLDGDVNLLGVIVSSDIDASAGAARATLDHYGLTGVPVGAYQGTAGSYVDVFAEDIRDHFGTVGQSRTAYVDSTTLYRQLIATATRDVTIVTVGGLTALSLFRLSAADVISASNGNTLATNNVTQLISMAGDYTSGVGEFNMSRDATSSKDIGDNWPTPVIWHGYSIGSTVTSGPPAGADVDTDPIKRAYGAGATTRPSWDPLAVLYAIDGPGSNFGMGGSNGTNTISTPSGNNTWTSTTGNDSYVSKVASDAALGAELNAILDDLIP